MIKALKIKPKGIEIKHMTARDDAHMSHEAKSVASEDIYTKKLYEGLQALFGVVAEARADLYGHLDGPDVRVTGFTVQYDNKGRRTSIVISATITEDGWSNIENINPKLSEAELDGGDRRKQVDYIMQRALALVEGRERHTTELPGMAEAERDTAD